MLNDPFHHIIKNNKPDKDIEIFWYELKKMIANTFDNNIPIDIDLMSTKLNNLQSNQKYSEIESQIHKYIGTFCKLYIINKCSLYNCNLLDTQIKRWNTISKKYPLFTIKDARIINESCCLFYIYVKYLSYDSNKDMENFFNDLSLDTEFNKELLINICIKHNYSYFLDKLSNCIDVVNIINSKYNTIIHKNTSGKKILNTLNNLSGI